MAGNNKGRTLTDCVVNAPDATNKTLQAAETSSCCFRIKVYFRKTGIAAIKNLADNSLERISVLIGFSVILLSSL